MIYRNLNLFFVRAWVIALIFPLDIFSSASSLLDAQAPLLTYEDVIHRSLENSLSLKISAVEIKAKEAEEFQADLYPNPSFTLGVDNFAGIGGERDEDDASEITYALTQLFLLGGKRCAEKSIAASMTMAAVLDHEIAKQDLSLEVTQAFIEAYAAQEKLKLSLELSAITKETHACMQDKVTHGGASTIEEKKAEIDCCASKINSNKAQLNLDQAQNKLASFLGCLKDPFPNLSFPFYHIASPGPLEELECLLEKSSEWTKGEIERWTASATTQLEKARGYPDLEVTAGVTSAEGFHEHSFFFELSIPLPIFDRNQGNIARARFQEWQALYHQENNARDLKKKLAILYDEWLAAYEEAKSLEKISTECAKETLQETQEGYDQGKFDKITLLEAKKSCLEINQQYVDALAEYHLKRAEVLRIIGQIPLD